MASTNVTVPTCSAHASASAYTAEGQANFNLQSWPYYKTYVVSAQVLPGVIFGVLFFIAAIVFTIWLLTLCCRSVGWRTRRTRVHDVPADGSRKRAAFAALLVLATLGVVGVGTWALVLGIKSTDGKVGDFWNLISSVQTRLQDISNAVATTGTDLGSVQASVSSSTTLLQDSTNAALATAGGLNVPATLSSLQALSDSLSSGQSGVQEAQSNIQGTGIVQLENFQNDYQSKTEHYWKVYRVIAVAVFFGLLILLGVVTGVLALVDRTPRLTATSTLFLLIWTGLVLLLGAGVLNLVWRVSRDGCLYGITYATDLISSDANTQNIVNYYFGRTSIPPQDVSQELFKFNLTQIQSELRGTDIQNLVAAVQTTGGQAVVARASASDQTNINALGTRLNTLADDLGTLNNQIQSSAFSGIVSQVKSLVCCGLTNTLWDLWLASVILGAVAGLLGVLAIIKVVTAIHSITENQHYTPHTPNGAVMGNGKSLPA